VKVRLLSIGRDRSGLYEPAVQEYAKRLTHYCRFELIELSEARGKTPEKSKSAEGEAILGKLAPHDWLVALDQRGKLLSSEELAQFLAKAQQQGKDLVLCIGGDEGLATEVAAKAQLTLSLSKMTLPHRLARVVIAEQLYRAFTILRGEPYHK
jgi:23S rRNA (pseudouridine1915-N3)-methyltransferase